MRRRVAARREVAVRSGAWDLIQVAVADSEVLRRDAGCDRRERVIGRGCYRVLFTVLRLGLWAG